MKNTVQAILLSLFILTACTNEKSSLTVKVFNPSNVEVQDAIIRLNEPDLIEKIKSGNIKSVLDKKNQELPVQFIEEDGMLKELLVLVNLQQNEKTTLFLSDKIGSIEFPKRTQAELSIKEGGEWEWVTKSNGNQQYEYKGGEWKNVEKLKVDEKHTDHSFDIRYEGPGWESDKVGYRFYLDWRNAVDLFGKKTETMVLQKIGLDGFDSYHEMCDWGTDILKVANSLGLGTIAYWSEGKANRVAKTDSIICSIDYNGILESKITTNYYGWETAEGKTDLTSHLSIDAGSFMTKCDLEMSNALENICTGIIIQDNTVVIYSEPSEDEWAYMATFGIQSLQIDNLGMFIIYKKSDLIELTKDKLSHVVVLKPTNNQGSYYFGAVWEQDSSKIKTEEEFKSFLDKELMKLNQPVEIK